VRAEVLIVGAGPVGSILALELARYDVASVVVERSLTSPVFPKMDYLNGRTMELLRRLGLSEPVRERCVDPTLTSNFCWTTGLADEPISVWHGPAPAELTRRWYQVTDGTGQLETYQRIPGNVLEETLREQVRRHPLVDLREGWNCTGVDAGPLVRLVDETGATREVRAAFVVGCDGANSIVRRSLGIDMPVAAPTTQRCSVYFASADPRLRAHGRAFVTVTTTGVTLVSRDERDLWTASFQVDTEASEIADPVAVLRDKLGVDLAVDEVISVSGWQGALAVADRYRAGPVFLAGDAVHRYYPFGGHGANTGIADAVDLAWKLAARLRGWGGERLLDSYEVERRPVRHPGRGWCVPGPPGRFP
jgi:2-polyprenyl-6-methoxyphenol hydroxylase-like FAD-dependent oxidoreductase